MKSYGLGFAVAVLAACIALPDGLRGQPTPPPTSAEYQAAIRQLVSGAAEDAGRMAQLRMALGQAEAQRDAALARVKELEAKAALPPDAVKP